MDRNGNLAQLVERLIVNQRVVGSNPSFPAIWCSGRVGQCTGLKIRPSRFESAGYHRGIVQRLAHQVLDLIALVRIQVPLLHMVAIVSAVAQELVELRGPVRIRVVTQNTGAYIGELSNLQNCGSNALKVRILLSVQQGR